MEAFCFAMKAFPPPLFVVPFPKGVLMDTKVVLLSGFSDEEALQTMRAVKSAIPDGKEIAFAMTTETNLTWKLSDLIEHISEEHRYAKERRDKGASSRSTTP
jgi:hypothetical protein